MWVQPRHCSLYSRGQVYFTLDVRVVLRWRFSGYFNSYAVLKMFIHLHEDVVSLYILSIILSVTFSFHAARNCGVLDIPVNGSITGSKTTFPSKLHFSCDDGFILRGSTTRQCLTDGTWSGNDTSCEGKVSRWSCFYFLQKLIGKPLLNYSCRRCLQ